jgi:hypothetical protein
MGPVRRSITRMAAWLAVTAAAVGLSWFAVRSVLRDTVFEAPPALAAQRVDGRAPDPASLAPASDATISATHRPSPPPSSASAAPSSAKPSPPAPASPPAVPRGASSGSAGTTRSFEVKGGRASFTFGADSAALIAATPNPGWAVKVWPGDRWLRVDFTRGGRTSSVFVTWNDHPPVAEMYES